MTLAKRNTASVSRAALSTRRALSLCRRRLLQRDRALRESEQKLAEQYRSMASVAHELRAPLQTVNVALALISTEALPTMERPLRLAKASLSRASALLYDLLDFSALAHGAHIPLEKKRQRLAALVTRALDDVRLRFPNRTFEELNRAPDAWVDVDEKRLAQVLDNLISNALLHGAAQSPVEVCVEQQAEGVALRVRNVGAISDAARASLFQPLSHGEGAMRRGSMGLGLYIVKQVAEAHGGRVELEADPDSTTFSVILPELSAPSSS
jgi:signal transduction histidine kinase